MILVRTMLHYYSNTFLNLTNLPLPSLYIILKNSFIFRKLIFPLSTPMKLYIKKTFLKERNNYIYKDFCTNSSQWRHTKKNTAKGKHFVKIVDHIFSQNHFYYEVCGIFVLFLSLSFMFINIDK